MTEREILLQVFAAIGALPIMCGGIAALTAFVSSVIGRDGMPPSIARVTSMAVELPGLLGACLCFIAISPVWVVHRMYLAARMGGDE